MTMYKKYMQRCIFLAKKGNGYVSPNPMVGSVIVHKNKIIGEGWHKVSGGDHAEVNAINSVNDKSLLRQSTLYVNLEPCDHFGKTPPCSDLILKYQIPKVVIGNMDINEKVSGRGIKKLRENGVTVITNVIEKECYDLNKRFFTYHKYTRPYIILKWAETNDGFIDKIRRKPHIKDAKSTLISDIYSRQLSHKFRTEEDAILVGKNTILKDNPSLTSRLFYGKNPKRVIIDKNLEINSNYKIFDKSAETIIINSRKDNKENNLFYKKIDFSKNVEEQILKFLHAQQILSLIIEGGRYTLQKFIDKNLYDEVMIFKSNINFYKGIESPKLNIFNKNISYIHSKTTDPEHDKKIL